MKVSNLCFAVAGFPPIFCLREINIDINHRMDLGKSAAAACKDATILADSCARLKMNAGTISVIPTISRQEVGEYFLVDSADLDRFAATIGLGDSASTFSCEALCTKSIEYLQNGRGWLLPPEPGQICTHWHEHSCVTSDPASFKSMGKLAEAMDISGANTKDDREPVHEKKKDLSLNMDASNGTPDLHYSAIQLALALANLFQVFPSPPISQTSLLEGIPPDFGDEVIAEDRTHWQEIVPLSEAWIGSALSEVPRNLHLVKVIMGRNDNVTIRDIRKILLGMQRTLGEVKIRSGEVLQCQTKTDMLAYVTQFSEQNGRFHHGEQEGARYVIRVCPRFMGEEFIEDPTYRYGTLVHEASHHWGTRDDEFEGGSPYGMMQSLLMAKMDSLKAKMNADNFMWLVYFLNLCSSRENVVVPASDADGPCKLQLKHVGPKPDNVKVRIQCKTEARGVTLNFMNKDRVYLSGEKKFGTLQADDIRKGEWSSLGSFHLPLGTRVHVFYEAGCNIWEALAIIEEIPLPVKPAVPSKLLHSLADASREPNTVPESGIWLPFNVGSEVDVTLHFGAVSDVLTWGGKEYKCCKNSEGIAPNKLVDVTSIKDRGCGTLGGSGWHSHSNKVFTLFMSSVYDGTCKISIEEFKNKTQAVGEAALPHSALLSAVIMGMPVSFPVTDEICSVSVTGAKRRGEAVSGSLFKFFSERACTCPEGLYVMGKDPRCVASVEQLRFFDHLALAGHQCVCAPAEI